MLNFTLMDKVNPSIRIDRLLSFLISFASDDINDKRKYFMKLNRTFIFEICHDETYGLNKKSHLKTLILDYLNFFIKTINNSFYSIIPNDLSKNPHLLYELNQLMTRSTDNEIDIFYQGFLNDDIEALEDDFNENELEAFFIKNYYIFDILKLRNYYFNLN